MSEKLLTIGMATYDDYDGVYFTIQALRLYHLLGLENNIEFIVLDNNPNGKHAESVKKFINNSVKGKYIEYSENTSSFNKYKIVEHATGKYVLILDCHIILQPNAINNLLYYFKEHQDCKDLIQGPLLYDSLNYVSTHFAPKWSGAMYGTWATNEEKLKLNEPFEIEMQGMGLLAFERKNWPKINQNFRGFGGEEGYISEKFKINGGKNICLPQLKWAHRFDRPNGVPYKNIIEDRVWNYFLGWYEIYRDENHPFIVSMIEYFNKEYPKIDTDSIKQKIKSLF
jgi:hypothetical protein